MLESHAECVRLGSSGFGGLEMRCHMQYLHLSVIQDKVITFHPFLDICQTEFKLPDDPISVNRFHRNVELGVIGIHHTAKSMSFDDFLEWCNR